MKFAAPALVLLAVLQHAASFATLPLLPVGGRLALAPRSSSRRLRAVRELTEVEEKLQKIEQLKIKSDGLIHPLKEEMMTTEIFVNPDAMQILKYHGSYMQTDREKKGKPKDSQFMLRLKQPAGELPPDLFRLLDDLSRDYGQGDLRATTRQCFQLHGVLKGDLKTVVSSIMNIGSSTVGACGDVSRNVMTTPAPFVSPEYEAAREWSKVFAHLFRPMTPAFTEIWLDGQKAATVETWGKEVGDKYKIDEMMKKDTGRGVVLDHPVEPIYGDRYLPKKFKIAVTVPGDNSLDIYTNDIGCVVIMDDAKKEVLGFNVMVGGGMGRTHNKESTFARAADHLGFVKKEDMMELMKCIVATQRDHGNREVRHNARMKYLVHTLGIKEFKKLVESYFGKEIESWRPMKEWKYSDWMGWWDQGDGKMFLGVHIDNGRVKDEGDFKLKTALRVIADKYNRPMVMSPTQSILIKDIDPKDRADIDAILQAHGVKKIEDIDPLARLAMSCPALPLCGLAMTEAERRMPAYLDRIRALMNDMGLGSEEIMIRMTGCPNGCARPYMAELAFVGDGNDSYQVWLGGSPVLTRTAWPFMSKMKTADLEVTMRPIFKMFKEQRKAFEPFGDWAFRVGQEEIEKYVAANK